MRIPLPVAMRLPMYHQYITYMINTGCQWISSNVIAKSLGLTPSTIRQDIKYLDKIESSSLGYSTKSFKKILENVLGISAGANIALVGAGSLGMALAHYRGFKDKGFEIKAMFDKKTNIVDQGIDGVPVYPLGRISEIIKKDRITIGIITTPAEVAQEVADILVNAGIKGIWNFAPINIQVPPNIALENVNLMPSLFSLAFKIKWNG